MSSELRLKKLRGSGGYIMASINDDQQMKGNLGGPDLFLAPIGRLGEEKISKHFCNTCEKDFEGPPKIQYENPNEEVADNLILAEKGQYLCNSCNGTIAEYREFKKHDEAGDIGNAKPLESETQTETAAEPQVEQQAAEPQVAEPQVEQQAAEPQVEQQAAEPQVEQQAAEPQVEQQAAESVTQPNPAGSVSSIEGKIVYDENANQIGKARQVGIDSNQSVVLLITRNDGTEVSVPWNKIKKIGEVILLGSPEQAQAQNHPGTCTSCGFANKEGSKFCEECGNKLLI